MVQSKCHTLLSHWPNTDHPIFRSSDHDRKNMKRVRGQRIGSKRVVFGSFWVELGQVNGKIRPYLAQMGFDGSGSVHIGSGSYEVGSGLDEIGSVLIQFG